MYLYLLGLFNFQNRPLCANKILVLLKCFAASLLKLQVSKTSSLCFDKFPVFLQFLKYQCAGFCSKPLSVYFLSHLKLFILKLYSQNEPSVRGQSFPQLSRRQNPFNFKWPFQIMSLILPFYRV